MTSASRSPVMRIGVDVRELGGGVRTGIGRYVEGFTREAARLRPDVMFFLYARPNGGQDLTGAAHRRSVLRAPFTLWFDQVSLPLALARHRIDVFFSPYYKAPLASPCPTVVTIHDLIFLRLGRRGLRDALFPPWARLIASRSAAVLTDSQHSRRDLEELLGLSPERIEVVPLGVSPEFSPAAREASCALRERLGIPERYILAVTNFRPHKNDRLLIRAFARVASTDPDVALVLAGRPAVPPQRTIRLVEELGLSSRIILPGPIAEHDLPALYAGACVFAFPSLYEGFGLPVLEAMASGVPVACSGASSLPEIASGAALLLDPEDQKSWEQGLHRLLTDEPMRRELTLAGRKRAGRFTWTDSARRILSVLERAAG